MYLLSCALNIRKFEHTLINYHQDYSVFLQVETFNRCKHLTNNQRPRYGVTFNSAQKPTVTVTVDFITLLEVGYSWFEALI